MLLIREHVLIGLERLKPGCGHVDNIDLSDFDACMAIKDEKKNQLNSAIQPILMAGEEVLEVSTGVAEVQRFGKKTERRGTLFITDRRVGVFTKKIGGHDMLDFSYGLLTSLEYKKGMMYGEITFLASGDNTRFHMIPKDIVESLVKIIRERMAMTSAKGGSTPTPLSVADELLKIAGLRDAGILTQEEFEAEKAKLLK